MLVCTRALVARYGGSEVRLVPGRSRVIDGHELARRFPHHFAKASGGPASRERILGSSSAVSRVRSASPSPAAEPTGLERWRLPDSSSVCRVDHRVGAVRVRLAGEARAAIMAEIQRSTEVDGCESGGLLLGSLSGSLAEVLDASGPGPSARRLRESLVFDLQHVEAVIDEAKVIGRDAIGVWHTHPGGDARTSDADLRAFVGQRRALGVRRYVAVIATPAQEGWRLTGWLVSAGVSRDLAELAFIR